MKRKALKNKLRCRMKTMSCSSQVALYGIRYGKGKRPFITAYIKHKNNIQSKQSSSQDLAWDSSRQNSRGHRQYYTNGINSSGVWLKIIWSQAYLFPQRKWSHIKPQSDRLFSLLHANEMQCWLTKSTGFLVWALSFLLLASLRTWLN